MIIDYYREVKHIYLGSMTVSYQQIEIMGNSTDSFLVEVVTLALDSTKLPSNGFFSDSTHHC